jgi:hypothetical protein
MDPDPPPDQDDFENPYAPPDSTFAEDLSHGPFGRIDFTVGDLFNWTWSLYKENLGICTSVVVGSFAINFAVSMVLNLLLTTVVAAVRDPSFAALMQVAVTFGAFVAGFWLEVGKNLALLKIARRQQVAFEDIFTGAGYVLTTILAWLVMMVCVAGPMVLAFLGIGAFSSVVQADQSILPVLLAVVVIGLLGAIAVYLSVRLSQYPFVVIDRNAGVFQSLRMSWYLTKNKVPTIILVYLLWFTIILAGLLTLCVGLIFAAPLASLLLAVTYQALTGQSSAAELQFLDRWDVDEDEG